jgi:hypothetical protein
VVSGHLCAKKEMQIKLSHTILIIRPETEGCNDTRYGRMHKIN